MILAVSLVSDGELQWTQEAATAIRDVAQVGTKARAWLRMDRCLHLSFPPP